MRHVGNVYSHFPKPIVEFPDRQGVVEVFCVVRVDGTGEHVSVVLPLGNVLLGNLSRNLLRRILHILRIFVWQSILSENGVHFRVVVALRSQYVHHFGNRVLMFGVGPRLYLHHSLVACFTTLSLSLWYDDVVGQQSVLCNKKSQVLVHLQLTHKLVFRSLKNSYNHGFLHMLLPPCHKGNLHFISIECRH